MEEAIEIDGKMITEDAGLMKLPEIKIKNNLEQQNESDSETEIEKELRECLQGNKAVHSILYCIIYKHF